MPSAGYAPKPHWSMQRPDLGCAAWECEAPGDPVAPVPLCQQHLRDAAVYVMVKVQERQAEEAAAPVVRPAPGTREGWVYFVRVGDLIKIGWTGQPRTRMRNLQPDEVMHLEPGTMKDEKRCHAAFAPYRQHGEYFRPEPELLAFIKQLREGQS